MNATEKRKWVLALRSGEYKQGLAFLRHSPPHGGETFCCLGVAACAIREVKPKLNARFLRANAFGLSADLQRAFCEC